MREIKFRIWDTFNCSWISNLLDSNTTHVNEWFKKENMIFQQYIGFKDKNGKEIYEGDIVRFNEPVKLAEDIHITNLYVFDFYEGSFTRPCIYSSINGSKFVKMEAGALNSVGRAKLDENGYFNWTKAEVVGNIFENPELLEQ